MEIMESGDKLINNHVEKLNKLKGTNKESDESIDYSIEVLELLKKWGVGSLSISELDKWRDRLIWHVRFVDEMEKNGGIINENNT